MQFSRVVLVLAALALPVSGQAQEGHPLVGTWLGEWGEEGHFLTLIMTWDGSAISGIVNPGPDATPVRNVQLDSSTWTVRMEFDIRLDTGETVEFSGDGRLENIGAHTRTLQGNWRARTGAGAFSVTRQSGA